MRSFSSNKVAGLRFSTHRVVGVRFHSRDDILVCVDSSNRFRLLDIQKRRLAACHDDVEFPQVPSGKGAWGGAGDVHPLSGIAFNPEDPLHSMLLFNHRYLFACRYTGTHVDSCCLAPCVAPSFYWVRFLTSLGRSDRVCCCIVVAIDPSVLAVSFHRFLAMMS